MASQPSSPRENRRLWRTPISSRIFSILSKDLFCKPALSKWIADIRRWIYFRKYSILALGNVIRCHIFLPPSREEYLSLTSSISSRSWIRGFNVASRRVLSLLLYRGKDSSSDAMQFCMSWRSSPRLRPSAGAEEKSRCNFQISLLIVKISPNPNGIDIIANRWRSSTSVWARHSLVQEPTE